MDQEQLESVFEDKYRKLLGETLEGWLKRAPQTEEQAFARCMAIDRELNASYDEWFDAAGGKKDKLQEHRDKLKAEYDLIEEMFHLEANDRDW